MINQETIQGERVVLQPATPEDERQILDWLLRSDVTPSLLGPPLFPERPLPPPEDSGERFDPHYLDGTAPELGRCFLILVDGEPVGQVTYSRTRRRNSSPDYPHPDPIVLLERFPKLFVVGDGAIRVVYDEENPCPLVMGPSRSSEPVASVWREPPPESLSMSRSPRLTQNRLLLCLVPRERAEIPDLLCRFDREECSGGQGRPRLRLAEMSQLHEGPFSFLARLACARRRRRYAEASCFRNAVRTRGVGPLAHQPARGSEVA